MIRWLIDSIKFLALLITSFCLVVGNGLLLFFMIGRMAGAC